MNFLSFYRYSDTVCHSRESGNPEESKLDTCLRRYGGLRLKIILLGFIVLGTSIIPGFPPAILLAQSSSRTVYIESEEVEPYLKKAEQFEKEGQWRRAIEQYQLIIKKFPDAVCRVVPDYFIGVRQYFSRKLAGYPPEGLAVYHQMFDTLSQGLFEKAVQNQDAGLLKRVVEEMFFSAYGDNAADYLAEMLAEEGRLAEASGYWEQLLDFYPDSEISKPQMMLKLAVSYLRQGRQSDYQSLREKLGENYSDSAVEWGNRQLTVDEIIFSLEQFDFTGKTPADDQNNWFTWGGNNAHNRAMNYDSMNDIKKWSHSFAASKPVNPGNIPLERLRRAPTEPPVTPFFTIYPAVTPDFIYVNNGVGIRQIKTDTGVLSAAFPPGLQETENFYLTLGNNLRFKGIFGIAVDNGKIIGNIFGGSPLSGQNPYPVSSLAALSTGSLKQLWNTADSNDQMLKEVNLFSPPLVSNGKVFAAAVKALGIENQIYLLCFNADNGSLLWKRFICSKITSQYDRRQLVMPLLAESNGLVFCDTNHGVIAALAEENGAIAWMVNYLGDSLPDTEVSRMRYPINQLPERGLNFPIIDKNLLCCLPSDCDKILGFDIFRGKKIWEKAVKPQGRIVGLVNDDLIVYDQELSAINFSGGKLKWSALGGLGLGLAQSDLVTVRYFYLNTPEGLCRFDLANKKIINAHQSWFDKENIRNIFITSHGLLAVSDTQISLYHDISRFMAEYRELESRQPDNLKLLYDVYIKVLIENKKFSEVIESLRRIKERVNPALLSGDNRKIFEEMMQILMARYEAAAEGNWGHKNFDLAAEQWLSALELAGQPDNQPDRARLKLRLADVCAAKGLFEEALMLYHEVILKYPDIFYQPLAPMQAGLADSSASDGPTFAWNLKSDLYAGIQIGEIISNTGRAVYRKIEAEAEQFFRQSGLSDAETDFKKKNELVKFLKTYPNSRRAGDAVRQLAEIFYRENDFKEALYYLRLFERNYRPDVAATQDKTDFSRMFLQTVDCYERLGNPFALIDFLENSIRTDGEPRLYRGEQVLLINGQKTLLKNYAVDKISLLQKHLSEETAISLSPILQFKIVKTNSAEQSPSAALPLNQAEGISHIVPHLVLTARGNDVECWDVVKQKKIWVDSAEQKSVAVKTPTQHPFSAFSAILETQLSGSGGLFINRGFYLQKNNSLNGKIIWQYQPPENYVISYIRTGGVSGAVFVGLTPQNPGAQNQVLPNKLLCLDEKDATLVWELKLGDQKVVRAACIEEYQSLVLSTASAIKIINIVSGQVLYEDRLFGNLPGPSYLHQITVINKNKFCYLNQKQELVLYDLALSNKMILKQFSGLNPQNLAGVWISLSDGFVVVAGLSAEPMVFDPVSGTERKLTMVAEHFQNQPVKAVWRSFIGQDGICYFWKQNVSAAENAPLPTLNTILLSYDINQDKVLWKSPLNDFTYTGSIKTDGEKCILSVGNFVSRVSSPFSVMMIDKKSGKRIWETPFIHNPNLAGYPSVQINGHYLIVNTQEGVLVYQ